MEGGAPLLGIVPEFLAQLSREIGTESTLAELAQDLKPAAISV